MLCIGFLSLCTGGGQTGRTEMKIVDMHGIRHQDVEGVIVSACAQYDAPFIVITGKSSIMKNLVREAANLMGLYTRDAIGNPGRVVVTDDE